MQTEQSASNDYGYLSPGMVAPSHTQNKGLAFGRQQDKVGNREITPDSNSYSLRSINSLEENVREQLKQSLEQKQALESQSSTLDLGGSMSRSKLSNQLNV